MKELVASKRKHSIKQYALFTTGIVVALMVLAIITLAALPVISPETGAHVADTLRGVFGPQAVAQLESLSFRIEDVANSVRYKLNGGQSQISFSETSAVDTSISEPGTSIATTDPPATATPEVQPVMAFPITATEAAEAATATPAPASLAVTTPYVTDSAVIATPAVTSMPTLPALTPLKPTATDPAASTALQQPAGAMPDRVTEWQPFGPAPSGQPVLARSLLQPDPARPYAEAALVRIDLSQVALHYVLGTTEPIAAKGTPLIQRSGTIPKTDQTADHLIAAYNGGFKTINGHYGVYYQGVTLMAMQDNLATMVIYRNGTVKIGAWDRDVTLSPDIVYARQNCPLLVDAGTINPDVNNENRAEWGYTVKNLDTTWRSGVGITHDGRYMIYAAGPSLTTASLAYALQQAGAYYAMQLDINGGGWYTRFTTYTPPGNPTVTHFPVIANGLLKQMYVPPTLYLTPYDRDFFYITTRAG